MKYGLTARQYQKRKDSLEVARECLHRQYARLIKNDRWWKDKWSIGNTKEEDRKDILNDITECKERISRLERQVL